MNAIMECIPYEFQEYFGLPHPGTKARLDLTSTFVLRVVIGKRCTGNLEYMDDVIRFFRCRFVQLAAQ